MKMRGPITFICLAATAVCARAQEPVKPWATSLGAGVALTSGNTDKRDINLSFNSTYDPKAVQLFKAEILYLWGESEGEKTVDKTTALGRYERLLSDRLFWFGEESYLRDPFKGIEYLIAPMAGVGYHFIKTEVDKLTFDGAVGGAFESNEPFGAESSFAMKAGESYERAFSPASKLTQRLSGLWKVDDFSDAHYHFDAGLTSTVAARAELKVSYVYDYKAEPPSPDIEKGDSAFFAALLFKW